MGITYILVCQNGDFYIGSTNNIGRRVKEHRTGKSRATRGKLPVKLIYQKEFGTLKEARAFEFFLKRQRSKDFYQKLFNNEIVWPRRLAA